MELDPNIRVAVFKDSCNLPTVIVELSIGRREKSQKIVLAYNSKMTIFMKIANKPTFH